MHRRDLPAQLGRAFSVAHSDALGVARSRLDANDLTAPFRGVRMRIDHAGVDDSPEAEHLGLARAFATRMSVEEFFSHATAAVVWGLPLPRRVLEERLVDVSVRRPHRSPRGRGVRGHEVTASLISTRVHESSLVVTSPASTWACLGAVLGEHDLVAVGEALIREPRRENDPPALATVEQLSAVIAAGRRPGVRALRRAWERMRPRVESRQETVLRLHLVDGGLPEPVTGFDVYAGDTRIARVDLAYPDRRVALEYEGEHHLTDLDQWTRDIHRYERLAAAGWTVIRVTRRDLQNVPALVARVRAALAA
jgi:hypothetical protein